MAENVTTGKELTLKQKAAIAALLSGGTVRAASKLAKIGERQLYRWLAEDAFARALQVASDETLAATVRALTDVGTLAVETLRNVMTRAEARDADQVRAANVALVHLLRIREIAEIERRLGELERLQNAKH